MPASVRRQRPEGIHADAELLEGEEILDESHQPRLAFLGSARLGPEGFHRLDAGDVLDQVRRELGGTFHRLAGEPMRGGMVRHHAGHQQRDERRRHQGQADIVDQQGTSMRTTTACRRPPRSASCR